MGVSGESKQKLVLKDIVLIGRTFDEYYRMFDLARIELAEENILDVASGVSSFCAEARSRGYTVTACDSIYRFPVHEIERQCREDLAAVTAQMPAIMDLYRWEYFKDINAWRNSREKAYTLFLRDYCDGHYVFADNEFTLSLMSHFLFVYDDRLDCDFHKATILDIIRITSGEIRIFPIVNLEGKRSLFVDELMKDRDLAGCTMDIEKVDYEFVINGNEMLVIGVA